MGSTMGEKSHKNSRTCLHCGEEFECFEYEDRATCCEECNTRYISRRQQGEGPPNTYSPYGPNWNKKRDQVLSRDRYRCQACGDQDMELREENGRGLDVHHVISKDNYRNEEGEYNHEAMERLENLVALCHDCHGTWEGVPLRPSLLRDSVYETALTDDQSR